MSHPAVDVSGFSFRIGEKEILKGVSLRVEEGEFRAVIGPDGAGKTTLLKCLMRILTGGTGSVRIYGKPLESYKQRDLARKVSYVPQADGRAFPFTVREFVTMGRYPYLSPFSSMSRDDEAAVDRVMGLTHIAEFAERHLDTLSGGERQKVFIAAALAQGAGLLLLDEPATFLDYRHQVEVHEILRQINRDESVTILMVTHNLNSALRHSRKITALKNGRVHYDGPTEGMAESGVIEDLYDTTFHISRHPDLSTPILVPKAVK